VKVKKKKPFSLWQTGGYTVANMIWDLMLARNILPTLAAVEAYYKGLKVIKNLFLIWAQTFFLLVLVIDGFCGVVIIGTRNTRGWSETDVSDANIQ